MPTERSASTGDDLSPQQTTIDHKTMCDSKSAFDNAIRGRLNAWFFLAFDGYIHQLTARRKAALFADLPDHILEIGAGVGANFRYLRPSTHVTAVEPNPHMLPGLRKQAEAYGVSLEVLPCPAEDIPIPDSSVEAVICTLVLCTVPEPMAALSEIRRILKPGGRFLFLEHVAAPARSPSRRIQDLLHSPWRYLFEGCHTNRNTQKLIESVGFQTVDVDQYKLHSPFLPVNTQISGIAVE